MKCFLLDNKKEERVMMVLLSVCNPNVCSVPNPSPFVMLRKCHAFHV